MAIDGLKEVQESVMRIEAGLSTYEKELALMGEDYQDIFRQQVRESAEREKAGLSRPVWIAQAYQQHTLLPQHSMNRCFGSPPMRGFSFARSGARWGQQVFRYHSSRYSLMFPECWLKRTSTWPEVNDRPVFTGW